MDWPTFIKDNSQALFTLIGVFLGAAITFLGNYLNNRFQARENDKERLEKRKEAKVQLAIELMQNDLKYVENANRLMFEILDRIQELNLIRNIGQISQEAWQVEFQSKITGENGLIKEVYKFETMAEILVYICGEEIYSTYRVCQDTFTEFLNVVDNQSATYEDQDKAYDKLIKSFGKLQQMLRDKLISIRDTE